MKKYIGLLALLFSSVLLSSTYSQSPPKPTKVFEANFKYFVHGVALDSTLEKWVVKHTGAIDKTITLTTQALNIQYEQVCQMLFPGLFFYTIYSVSTS